MSRQPYNYPGVPTGHKADEEAWIRHLQNESEWEDLSWKEEPRKVTGYGGEILDLGEEEMNRLLFIPSVREEERDRFYEMNF